MGILSTIKQVATGINPLSGVIDFAAKAISNMIPDPNLKAQVELEILKIKQTSEFKEIDERLEMAKMQTDINKIEAASGSLFVSGARPAILWVCAVALAYTFILQPFLNWLYTVMQALGWFSDKVPFPGPIDTNYLFQLMGMLLGVSYLRSRDKSNGVATQYIQKKS